MKAETRKRKTVTDPIPPPQPSAEPRWKSFIVGHGMEDPAQLAANPLNSWKIHPLSQQEAIEGLLDEIGGWFKSVIVDKATGFVVDGHARVALAIRKGEPLVPVEYVELSEEQMALAIAFGDYTAGLSVVDKDEFKLLLGKMKPEDERVKSLMENMAKAMRVDMTAEAAEAVPEAQLDRIAEVHAEIGAQLGDLWLIPSKSGKGEHRLVCGDSTDATTAKQALGDLHPNLMMTDPPYGVNYNPQWRKDYDPSPQYSLGKVNNDDRVDWTDAYRHFPGNVAYVWHAAVVAAEVAINLFSLDFQIRGQIIWRKHLPVMSRGHYHWQHEPCWYAVRKGQSANWKGDRTQTTVWDIANMSNGGKHSEEDIATGHSTQKPLDVYRRAVLNHTEPGDAIYDPFLGSGTAICAAEITERIGVGIELDPAYASVIVQRLRDMGLEPYRASK